MASTAIDRLRERFNENRTAWSIVLVSLIGGAIFVCLFAVLLLGSPEEDDVPPTFVAVEPVPEFDAIITGGDLTNAISVTLDLPLSLSVAEQVFRLQAQQIAPDGIWNPISVQPGMGIWVYGSVVNYIVGLPDNAANRALLDRLTVDDQLTLSLRSGSSLRFLFRSREIVPALNRDVFSQTTPGVTIVLLGTESDQRLVVKGRYVVSSATSPADPVTGPLTLGQTAELAGLQVTVTGAGLHQNRPEAPAGFDFFLIDYQLQNVGTSPFDTAQLRLALVDNFGTQYAMNPAANLIGNFAPLSGFLNPGGTVAASVGYQLPGSLSGVQLRWLVTDVAGQVATFNLPFGPGPDTGAYSVAVQQASVTLDGTSLLLQGQIVNQGPDRLIIGEQEISLLEDASGTLYLLLSTSPGFPWVIEPEQTIPFAVTFQRPVGSTATFNIRGHAFQLVGLR